LISSMRRLQEGIVSDVRYLATDKRQLYFKDRGTLGACTISEFIISYWQIL